MSGEPLLQVTSNRYTRFPIVNQNIWHFRETHHKTIWFPHEIDMSGDLNDWKKLNNNEKHFIKHILAFFAASDGIVMSNIMTNFSEEIYLPEAQSYYAVQNFMEDIHGVTYAKLIQTYVSDDTEKMKLFNAIETMPAIKKKAEWALKYTDPKNYRFAVRLVAFIIIEGLFFSSAFASIYWFKDKNLLSGLCISNDYIARDEGLHVEFAIMLYNNYVKNKLSQDEIDNIITVAISIEKEFILESLPCSLLGMNSKLMSQYVEFVAQRLISQIGYTTDYKDVKCPFGFMDKIALQNQTSFFDKRPTEYQKNMKVEVKENIDFDMDF